MTMQTNVFSSEICDRPLQMVLEHKSEQNSLSAAIGSIVATMGDLERNLRNPIQQPKPCEGWPRVVRGQARVALINELRRSGLEPICKMPPIAQLDYRPHGDRKVVPLRHALMP